jgi:hypothetical protein
VGEDLKTSQLRSGGAHKNNSRSTSGMMLGHEKLICCLKSRLSSLAREKEGQAKRKVRSLVFKEWKTE